MRCRSWRGPGIPGRRSGSRRGRPTLRPASVTGAACWRPPPLGTELLHLFGNVIFLARLVVLAGLLHLADRRLGGTALAIQGLHVLEHVVLTGSLVATGSAFGLSTRLDEVLPWGASTVRVLFHFGVNAVATTHTIAAVREAVRAAGWRRWPAAFRPMATPSGAGRALR